MSTNEKYRRKALPLAIACGVVSVLMFFGAVGVGARMARMSHMNRQPGMSQQYRTGPGGRGDMPPKKGRRGQMPGDQRGAMPGPGGPRPAQTPAQP